MDISKALLQVLWQQDFRSLVDPKYILVIYSLLFIILFLENGLIPAAFLPGDSLLILVGVLIAKGIMNFLLTLFILTTAASLGYWIGYIQGRWLGKTAIVQKWMSYLKPQYYHLAHQLFYRHGFSAFLIGRFIAFVRTLLPTIAGLSCLSNIRFQLFNWMSGFLWVVILTLTGFALGKIPLFHRYENELIFFLTLFPLLLLVIGLFGSLVAVWRKR